MSLHPSCEEKILALGSGQQINRGFLDLFKAVVNDAEAQGLPSGTLVIPYYDENSNLQPDDWAAELHFVVRKVESVNEETVSEETEA